MRNLRLKMPAIDFDQLAQLGRAVIPTVAPAWTDHNTHDPGIMLLELMAWVSEAQIYSISRTRRDERLAYARLLGIAPRGPVGAHGLVWPLVRRDASGAPVLLWPNGAIVARGTSVVTDAANAPAFFAAVDITLARVVLARIETHFADGSTRDWTTVNAEDGATFMPFGDTPSPGSRLLLHFEPVSVPGDTDGAALPAMLSIGVEIAPSVEAAAAAAPTGVPSAPRGGHADGDVHRDARRRRLAAMLEAGDGVPVQVVRDTTDGLLRSGYLLLRLDPDLAANAIASGAVDPAAGFTISLRSTTGQFLRPPHLQRVAPNVVPVEQIESVQDPVTLGNGLPDQTYCLDRAGLVFPTDDRQFKVQTIEGAKTFAWTRVEPLDLERAAPDARVYTLDTSTGTLTFGNGINGLPLPAGAALLVRYQVGEGARGNLPAHRQWKIDGIGDVFGTNGRAMTGGANAIDLDALRALARQRSQTTRPLVTASDLEQAARGFTDLGVTRALELPSTAGARRVRGARVLVVVGPQRAGAADHQPESPDLLEEIRARLAPRLPLGQRLSVIAPNYITARITARLVAVANVDPSIVAKAASDALRTRLAIVPAEPGASEWPFGRDVTALAVKGWLRKVDGVAKVAEVTLTGDEAGGVDKDGNLTLGPIDLPRLAIDVTNIIVDRSPQGARR